MSLSLFLNVFSKDWEIHGDGATKVAEFNMSGWPFNVDLSEAPEMEMHAYAVAGGGGIKIGVFTASPQDDRILLASHGLVNGDQVRFVLDDPESCVLPFPLNDADPYFVINTRGNDFQVSSTLGGVLINLTDRGVGSNEVWKGGTVETLETLGCKQEGSIVTITFAAPIAVGEMKTVRLKAKITL